MGRSVNSFTSYVGHALEINTDKVDLPEKDLWIAVLCRAALDACKGDIPYKNLYGYNRNAARHFFLEGGSHFQLICEMAGRNPDYIQQKIRKVILRKEGWNIDVPITSHYRQGPKRGRKRGKYKVRATKPAGKKHLTGNAYYAAKAKKNLYYQGMGSKGGRPRIYNVV